MLKCSTNLKIYYYNNKIFVFLYGKIFFVQKLFKFIAYINKSRQLKYYWLCYVLKVLYHFGLVDLKRTSFLQILIKSSQF